MLACAGGVSGTISAYEDRRASDGRVAGGVSDAETACVLALEQAARDDSGLAHDGGGADAGGWGQTLSAGLIAATLLGSWLVIASANALNQAYEWRQDALMTRTAQRPIPSGRISPWEGWLVGALWGVLGTLTLALWVNLPVAILGAVSILLYAFAYTPLKQRTHFSTAIGAIPARFLRWRAGRGAGRVLHRGMASVRVAVRVAVPAFLGDCVALSR